MDSRKQTVKLLNHVAGVIAAFALILVSSGSAQAQLAPQVVHAFSGSGSVPFGMIQGKDGNFYGTTFTDGAFGGGTVFRMIPAGVVASLYAFDCSTEGCQPQAALIQAKDGNFYGTAATSGAFGGGTVFKLTPTGVLTTVHAFDCSTEGCFPFVGALVQAKDGNFYGTTYTGGKFGGGTIFKLTPAGVLTTLHDFDCSTEG